MEHTETYYNYIIEIHAEPYPNNPRTDYDHLGTMYCFHKRYQLGDKHTLSIDEVKEMAESTDYISLPLYLYDHSGITMQTKPFSCPFDSGQVGIIIISKEKIRSEYGNLSANTENKARQCLQHEVLEYDQYLTGNVFYYVVKDCLGIEISSCSGLYGYDYTMLQAKEEIDFLNKHEKQVSA